MRNVWGDLLVARTHDNERRVSLRLSGDLPVPPPHNQQSVKSNELSNDVKVKWMVWDAEGKGTGAWLARLSGIILVLPASMAAGWILGFFVVDRYLKIFPWGSIILTLAGAGAGFYEIVRILSSRRER